MKASNDFLYSRNIELNEQLWAAERRVNECLFGVEQIVEALKEIRKLNTLGKTKQIADKINELIGV